MKTNQFPIPVPLILAPGTQHALLDVHPATQVHDISIQWIFTDDVVFGPDLRRAIDAVIRRSPFAIAPRLEGQAPCRRFLINITSWKNGEFEVEPVFARFADEDFVPVARLIDCLVMRLNSLLKSAARPIRARATIVHWRN